MYLFQRRTRAIHWIFVTGAVAEIEDEEDELDLEVFGSGCVSVGMRLFSEKNEGHTLDICDWSRGRHLGE